MDWLTDSLKAQLLDAGVRQAEAAARDEKVDLPGLTYIRLYGENPAGWILAYVEPHDPDLAYGLCDLGAGMPELGYVRLSELAMLRGVKGSGVSEDPMFKDAVRHDIVRFAKIARDHGQIVLTYRYTVTADDLNRIEGQLREKASRKKRRSVRPLPPPLL